MGVSTDAILAYGYDLEEDEGVPEDFTENGGDLGEYLGKRAGLSEDDWQGQSALARKCPVEIISHCSGDYPMYFLALNRNTSESFHNNVFEIRCSRGSVVEVDLPIPTDEEIERLHAFIEEHGFKVTGKLGWHLMSWWC